MILRDAKGTMKLRVPEDVAMRILREASGHWRPRHLVDGTSDSVFEITDAGIYTYRDIQFYLWVGDYLCYSNSSYQ